LKAALWFSIGKIVDEESLRRNRNATPQFIGALTEMVWTQLGMETLLPSHAPFISFTASTHLGTSNHAIILDVNRD
jgi:centromere protein S